VERPRGVEDEEAQLGALAVPPVEGRSGDGAVHQPPEPGAAGPGVAQEGGVGGRADGDVVGVAEDAVRAEGDDDVRALLLEDARDRVHEPGERHVAHLPVREAQPLVPVGHPSKSPPGRRALRPPDLAEVLTSGGEAGPDVSLTAVRGVHEHEAEAGLVGVQRDAARHPVGVVVGVGDHAGERATAGHGTHPMYG
jgi:hypothetical protein